MSRQDIQLKQNLVPAGETLRVASLNLLNNHSHLALRLQNLATEITRLDFDVLALQEVLGNATPNVVEYLTEHTHLKHAHAATRKQKSNGDTYGTVTLSRMPFEATDEVYFDGAPRNRFSIIPTTVTTQRVNGRQVTIFNSHLAWGSEAEPTRMAQAEEIYLRTAVAAEEDPNAVFLLLGDFNTLPDSSTVRFLRGKQGSDKGHGTLWVDAWEMWGNPENEITSDAETYWGGVTGIRKSGLHYPSLIPKRRIDYILSHGWCYGKQGSPLSFHRFADTLTGDENEISDHFGIYADIYMPRVG